jgi:predicted ribosomally synthesized peptide with SipW-like signal peptide
MKRSTKCGIAGFILGLGIAGTLALMSQSRSLSPLLLICLWPSAIFGIGATGWSDGIIFHCFQFLLVFGGNGILYGGIAAFIGNLFEKRFSNMG